MVNIFVKSILKELIKCWEYKCENIIKVGRSQEDQEIRTINK
jgi:hypothetical protein